MAMAQINKLDLQDFLSGVETEFGANASIKCENIVKDWPEAKELNLSSVIMKARAELSYATPTAVVNQGSLHFNS